MRPKKLKVGDLVYHENDKLKEYPYIIKDVKFSPLYTKQKIYQCLVSPVYGGRIDNTTVIYFYNYSLVKKDFKAARSAPLITKQLVFNSRPCISGLELQWSYKCWKPVLDAFEKGTDIVRFTDSWGEVLYVKIKKCVCVEIPNMNDRKDDVHSFVKRIRITIDRLL